MRIKLCPTCKTGSDYISLDSSEPMCPYIGLYKYGKCSMYVKFENTNKVNYIKKLLRFSNNK